MLPLHDGAGFLWFLFWIDIAMDAMDNDHISIYLTDFNR
jgi:hypothetical protein